MGKAVWLESVPSNSRVLSSNLAQEPFLVGITRIDGSFPVNLASVSLRSVTIQSSLEFTVNSNHFNFVA